jgi:hypothetical protein
MDPLSLLGVFISVAGIAERMGGADKKAQDARSVAESNAKTAEEAAADAVARAGLPGSRARMHGSQVIGEARAQTGASGVDVAVGSPATVAAQTRYFSDMDELIIRNNAAREAWGYKVKANLFRRQGAQQVAAAETEKDSALIGGAAQMLGPLGKIFADIPSRTPRPGVEPGLDEFMRPEPSFDITGAGDRRATFRASDFDDTPLPPNRRVIIPGGH